MGKGDADAGWGWRRGKCRGWRGAKEPRGGNSGEWFAGYSGKLWYQNTEDTE